MRDNERFSQDPKRIPSAALFLIGFFLVWAGSFSEPAQAQDLSHGPVKGMVTMVDLGADKCVPCKMMAPILEKLKKAYEGKAAIIFIDVWKDSEPAHRYGIRAIPTQIFFDAGGKEVHRHVGFMNEKDITDQLTKMGVK